MGKMQKAIIEMPTSLIILHVFSHLTHVTDHLRGGCHIIPIFHMRKLRPLAVVSLIQSHSQFSSSSRVFLQNIPLNYSMLLDRGVYCALPPLPQGLSCLPWPPSASSSARRLSLQ